MLPAYVPGQRGHREIVTRSLAAVLVELKLLGRDQDVARWNRTASS